MCQVKSIIWKKFRGTQTVYQKHSKDAYTKQPSGRTGMCSFWYSASPMPSLHQNLQGPLERLWQSQMAQYWLYNVECSQEGPYGKLHSSHTQGSKRKVWNRSQRMAFGRPGIICCLLKVTVSLHPYNKSIKVRKKIPWITEWFCDLGAPSSSGRSIVFWGGIMFGRCTTLIPMIDLVYRNSILQPVVIDFTVGEVFT